MIQKNQKQSKALLFFSLIFCVICLEIFLFHRNEDVLILKRLQGLLTLIFLISFYGLINSFNWFQNKDPLQKIKFIGGTILILWGGSLILNNLSPNRETLLFWKTLPQWFFFSLFTWGMLLISLIICLGFKGLIYVQQSRKTAVNFRFLCLIVLVHMIINIFRVKFDGFPIINLFNWNASALDHVFFVLFILFSVINGFQSKWIHYLDKNQKIAVFFGEMVVFVLIIFTFPNLSENLFLYNTVIGMFFGYLGTFSQIYVGITFLNIFIHLPSAGLMDRRIKEIRSLQHLSSMINSVLDRRELENKITEMASNIVGADYSWLEIVNGSSYNLVSTHGIDSGEIDQMPDVLRNKIRQEVIAREEVLFINDLIKYFRTKKIKTLDRRFGSLLATKICFQNKNIGILYTVKQDRFGFIEDSQPLFQAFADQVGVAIENVRLIELTIEQERYREELRLAHEAQMRLLPQRLPQIAGFEVDGFCITANDMGGDFYDVLEISHDRIDLVIGDVSGKGASAAFYMAELKGMIQSLASLFTSPKDIMIEMNKYLYKNLDPETFVTMIYAILIPSKREIRFARAGHPPLGYIKSGNVRWIEPKGLGLGLSDYESFKKNLEEKKLGLKKGDMVFFYTDGLVEARNGEGIEFGENRLTEILLQFGSLQAQKFSSKIRKTMEQYTQDVSRHDDMTTVVLQYQKGK